MLRKASLKHQGQYSISTPDLDLQFPQVGNFFVGKACTHRDSVKRMRTKKCWRPLPFIKHNCLVLGITVKPTYAKDT